MKDINFTVKALAIACLVVAVCIISTGCASTYTPTVEHYEDELNELVGVHEDQILVFYGRPDEILELSEGTKGLVYTKLPYKSSPITDNKNKDCRTVFQISEANTVAYIRAEGNFCIK